MNRSKLFLLLFMLCIDYPLNNLESNLRFEEQVKTDYMSAVDRIDEVFSAVMKESLKRHFDPILVLSIIEVESGFAIKKRGSMGEVGLMQVMPSTGEWMAEKIGIPWEGEVSLENPAVNIEIGVAYLALLRDAFPNRSQLYLTAYNMGARKLTEALRDDRTPRIYASHVLRNYKSFYSKIAHSENLLSL